MILHRFSFPFDHDESTRLRLPSSVKRRCILFTELEIGNLFDRINEGLLDSPHLMQSSKSSVNIRVEDVNALLPADKSAVQRQTALEAIGKTTEILNQPSDLEKEVKQLKSKLEMMEKKHQKKISLMKAENKGLRKILRDAENKWRAAKQEATDGQKELNRVRIESDVVRRLYARVVQLRTELEAKNRFIICFQPRLQLKKAIASRKG